MSQNFLLNISRNEVCLSNTESVQSFSELRPIFTPAATRCGSAAFSSSLTLHCASLAGTPRSPECWSIFLKGSGERALHMKKSKHSRLTEQNTTNQFSLKPCKGKWSNIKIYFPNAWFLITPSSLLIDCNTYKLQFSKPLLPTCKLDEEKKKRRIILTLLFFFKKKFLAKTGILLMKMLLPNFTMHCPFIPGHIINGHIQTISSACFKSNAIQ